MKTHPDHLETDIDLTGENGFSQSEKAIVAKKFEMGKKRGGRIIGVTASTRHGQPIGARQELRDISLKVREPIVTTRSPKIIEALKTLRTGFSFTERQRKKIKADINAS